MYDMKKGAPTRVKSKGFVVSSNDEWIKAAYFDPKGGGTDSYWAYPTGPFDPPNLFEAESRHGGRHQRGHPAAGDLQPERPELERGHSRLAARSGPDLVSVAGRADLRQGLPPRSSRPARPGVAVHGECEHGRPGQDALPWGTYDQGGNVVEVLDTLAPQPPGYNFLRDWRYYHGGVANAPAYQVEISAFGYFPGDPAIARFYPWLGFRLAVIGDVG